MGGGTLSTKRNIAAAVAVTTTSSIMDDDEFSYGEAKKMRLQIEKDVMLLRNRVRMLQQEE